ncbi:MAG: TetR/AcrR family transcriptional regulator [Butyribacter sp.]|nr:TetR/AcrR family transcriptional regulator [bacterium]MDY3853660.1 TetR/AcrR family transcriptional regulator [Butyribacter sp.]
MGKIEDKKRKKKEALLKSAYQLFTEKGIDNTSISEIAGNAKMAKGTFYLYFKDKYEVQDCLIAQKANLIFEKANKKLDDWIEHGNCRSFEDCVIFLADCIIDQLNENPSLLRFIAKNLSWGVFSNIRFQEKDNQNCMDVFDSLLEQSEKQYRQKELMIYMIVELVNATCYNVILYDAPVALEKLKKELYETIRGILHQFECKG